MEEQEQTTAGGSMREVAEGERLEFPCGGCGAELEFAPGQSSLQCEYCGHTEEIPTSKEGVVEHAFEEYEGKPREKGWGTETKTYDCQSCGATTSVEANVTSFSCPFCESNQVEVSEGGDRIRPESVLPFEFDRKATKGKIDGWIQSLWFRPNALKKLAQVDRTHGVYIPHWTYDSLTRSFWEAESGTYYYENKRVTDSEGNTTTERVRKVRWRWVDGTHQAFFDDVLVGASRSVDEELLEKIYPYRTEALVDYDPRFLVGWAAEDYSREMPDCWPDAKRFIDGAIRRACSRKVPGDTHRKLSVRSSYLNRTYKLCLLPVWVASYRYGGEVWPVLINGQTGEVQGKAPLSWVKIVFAVLVAVVLVGAVMALAGG